MMDHEVVAVYGKDPDEELEEIIPVLFRVDKAKSGFEDPFAVFPTLPGTHEPWTCTYYASYGGHGSGDVFYMINKTRPARPEEYADLKEKLEKIGYRMVVRKRISYKMYLKRVEELNRYTKGG